MNETTQIILALYHEQKAQARQHEDLRASLTNFVLIISGAVLAFATTGPSASTQDLAGTFLVGLGILGAVSSYKHYERFRYHTRWATAFDAKLRALAPETEIEDFEKQRYEHSVRFGWIGRFRLHRLWITLHLFIAALGAALVLWT